MRETEGAAIARKLRADRVRADSAAGRGVACDDTGAGGHAGCGGREGAPTEGAGRRARRATLGARLLTCLALTAVAGLAASSSAFATNVTYHGGPILHQTTSHVIFVETPELTRCLTCDEQIEQFLFDLAADSGSNPAFAQDSHVPGVPTGRPSNPYSVSTQYYQIQEGNVVNPNEYNQTYGGSVVMTDPEGSGCNVPRGALLCLSDGQIQGIVNNAIAAKGWHRGFFDTYFVILPAGAQACWSGEKDCGPYATGSNGEKVCGHHDSFGSGGGGNNTVFYALLQTPGGFCSPTATNWPQPNGTAVDITISNLSHENNEMLTSPQVPDHSFLGSTTPPGWWVGEPIEFAGIKFGENQTAEIGDLCVGKGPKIGENELGEYDVLINHHPYELQPEWSNEGERCRMNMAEPPTALIGVTEINTLENAELSGATSEPNDDGGYIIKYKWEWDDGNPPTEVKPPGAGEAANPFVHHKFFEAGPHTVKLTVTSDSGLQSTTTKTVNVGVVQPQLSLTVPNSDYNEGEGQWTAKLTVPNGESVALLGVPVKVFFSNETCEGTVNGSGELTQSTATCKVASGQPALLPPGSYLAAAEVAALPGLTKRAVTLAGFTVSPEQTRVTFFGPPTVADGQPVTLGVLLTTDDATALVSPVTHKVEITLGGSAGFPAQTCTGEVAVEGINIILTCTIKEVDQNPSLKTLPVKARFAGDGYYEPSESGPATVNQTLSTAMSLQASPNPVTFGSRLTLSAKVAAHAPATATPTGTVTFYDDGNRIGEPQTLSGGTATLTVSSLTPGAHLLTANYSGDGNYPPNSAGTSSEVQVVCTRTIEGSHPLEAVIAAGSNATCIKNATVLSVTGLAGGSIVVENTTVVGAINTNEAGAIRICGSSTGLLAASVLTASTGFVEVGDGGDETSAPCAGNSFNAGLAELRVERSRGGAEIGGNKVGALYLNNSTGEGPAPENRRPEIESNEVAGVLSCVNNSPAPTNDGRSNKLAFGGFGQCSGF